MRRRPPTSPLFPYTTLFRSFLVDELLVAPGPAAVGAASQDEVDRSEEHTSELQSLTNLVCRLLLEKKTLPRTHVDDTQVRNDGARAEYALAFVGYAERSRLV